MYDIIEIKIKLKHKFAPQVEAQAEATNYTPRKTTASK